MNYYATNGTLKPPKWSNAPEVTHCHVSLQQQQFYTSPMSIAITVIHTNIPNFKNGCGALVQKATSPKDYWS